jgi:hypothetical protein
LDTDIASLNITELNNIIDYFLYNFNWNSK